MMERRNFAKCSSCGLIYELPLSQALIADLNRIVCPTCVDKNENGPYDYMPDDYLPGTDGEI